MTEPGFTLFDTAIGPCGVAWSGRGITAVQLPEADAARTRARLLRRSPQLREAPPPAAAQRAIDGIVALLHGEPADLSDIVLDMDRVESFERRVYEIARTIAPGATLSYGEIAVRLGDRALARDVGQALGRNPFPLIVPCHRVLAAGGKVGGFSANGGITTKLRLLTIERARTSDEPTLFDGDGAFGLAVKPRAERSLRNHRRANTR
jgi:methylated-DNA-[protein]-cysteine S-methyltransferase